MAVVVMVPEVLHSDGKYDCMFAHVGECLREGVFYGKTRCHLKLNQRLRAREV